MMAKRISVDDRSKLEDQAARKEMKTERKAGTGYEVGRSGGIGAAACSVRRSGGCRGASWRNRK
ncbi:MAG: hypothetical protein C0391_05470 [Anaerolinea sp.]|nr:hypothetical protein [Anaerolinea sp.]